MKISIPADVYKVYEGWVATPAALEVNVAGYDLPRGIGKTERAARRDLRKKVMEKLACRAKPWIWPYAKHVIVIWMLGGDQWGVEVVPDGSLEVIRPGDIFTTFDAARDAAMDIIAERTGEPAFAVHQR